MDMSPVKEGDEGVYIQEIFHLVAYSSLSLLTISNVTGDAFRARLTTRSPLSVTTFA